jgi:peptidyl-prolyl cis-trans isomerase SurA
MANSIAGKLKNNPELWRTIPETYGTDAGVDSGRYELQQMPFKFDPADNKEGFLSKPERLGQEDPYTFALILKPYKNIEQRTFPESKGLVINDYQQVLEKKWIEKLRKKYPVSINQAVWKTVN